MKKVLIVLSCIALVLPLFALSAFAEDSITVDFSVVNYSDNETRMSVNGVSRSNGSYSVSGSAPLTLTVRNGSHTYSNPFGSGVLTNYSNTYYKTDTITERYLVGTVHIPYEDLAGLTFTDKGSTGSGNVTATVIIDAPIPNPLAPVDEGVTTFIGYGGQVLSFLTSTPAILTLIGLSVGLAFIIPFGIRKIKEMVKGY